MKIRCLGGLKCAFCLNLLKNFLCHATLLVVLLIVKRNFDLLICAKWWDFRKQQIIFRILPAVDLEYMTYGMY